MHKDKPLFSCTKPTGSVMWIGEEEHIMHVDVVILT